MKFLLETWCGVGDGILAWIQGNAKILLTECLMIIKSTPIVVYTKSQTFKQNEDDLSFSVQEEPFPRANWIYWRDSLQDILCVLPKYQDVENLGKSLYCRKRKREGTKVRNINQGTKFEFDCIETSFRFKVKEQNVSLEAMNVSWKLSTLLEKPLIGCIYWTSWMRIHLVINVIE